MNLLIQYGFLFLTLIITLGAQIYIDINYSKTKRITNKKKLTGKEAARIILDRNGLENVKVEEISGFLSDHYDPREKVVRLSPSIANEKSIAAVSVASHECGHALQDKNNYFFLIFRNSLVPIVNFASYAGYTAICIGIFFSSLNLLWLGIIMEVIILFFQIITLPVEINASKRALEKIQEYDLLIPQELAYSKKMLTSAAMTYVASVATAILQILRLVLLFTNNDNEE